jgi:hypothetical protein
MDVQQEESEFERVLPPDLLPIFERRDSGAAILRELSSRYAPSDVSSETQEQRVWELSGLFFRGAVQSFAWERRRFGRIRKTRITRSTMRTDFDARWDALAEEVLSGMKEWRLQHPKATLRQIEAALDERLGKMRARMLQDAALASVAADLKAAQGAEQPHCGACGAVLVERTVAERQLITQHNQVLKLERSYGVCPTCGAGLFPPG